MTVRHLRVPDTGRTACAARGKLTPMTVPVSDTDDRCYLCCEMENYRPNGTKFWPWDQEVRQQ